MAVIPARLHAARTEFSRDSKTTGVPSPNRASPLSTRPGPCSAPTPPCSRISISVSALLRRRTTDGGKSGVRNPSPGFLNFFYHVVITFDRRSFARKLCSHAPPGHLSPHRDSAAAHCGLLFSRNVSQFSYDRVNRKHSDRAAHKLYNMASNAQASGADLRAEELRRRNVAGQPAASPSAQAQSAEKSKEKVCASRFQLQPQSIRLGN